MNDLSKIELEDDDISMSPPVIFRQLTKPFVEDDKDGANVLMIGTGEYTTGCVQGNASKSDKAAGVVALTMFDLRSREKVNRIGLCGRNGSKFVSIRQHLKNAIEDVYSLDTRLETFPSDNHVNENAYRCAIDKFEPGDAVIIFTPDDSHFDIACYAVSKGLHVLITKPAVKTLDQHIKLCKLASENNVLVAVEVHKRFDPMYVDARDRIINLGNFSYFYSYMSQPKSQLDTFKDWAGKSSDISYYLNSHHIDFHEWCCGENSRPCRVVASSASGVAQPILGVSCEDTITLLVDWENRNDNGTISRGSAIYTSSWIAPTSDVHSQQLFHYMGEKGEIRIDQGHRGYTQSTDQLGYRSVNPLFMKYTPTNGKFSGQNGYGYRSLEAFIDATYAIKNGKRTVDSYRSELAILQDTFRTTAILEAGRRSLDEKSSMIIEYDESSWHIPISIHPGTRL